MCTFFVCMYVCSLAPGSPGQPVVRLLCSFSSIEACVAVVTECNHTQEVGLTCTNEG